MTDVMISYDVYISYAGDGLSTAGRIKDALEQTGISCWYSMRDAEPSATWAGDIARAIRACKILLLIVSKDAESSKYVQSELALAYRRVLNYENIILVPFYIEHYHRGNSTFLDYYLATYQIIDGCPPDEQHIRELVRRITRMLGRGTVIATAAKAADRPAEQA